MIHENLPRIGIFALAFCAASTVFSADLRAQEQDSPWSFSGDARFRLEFNDTNGVSDRHRQRLRLRLGASYEFSDEFTLGGRMVTGDPNDPKSPHQDLGNGFTQFEFTLDRLFVRYTPDWMNDGAIVAGKFGNPVYRNPVYGELVWDADVQAEGLAVVYDTGEIGPFQTSGLVAAQIAVIEQGNGEDLWATLLNWHGLAKRDGDSSIDAGLSYYFYGDLTPDGSGALLGTGNATAGGEFLSDFGVLDGVLAYNRGDFTLSTEFIKNLRADNSAGDTGFALGGAMKTESGKFYYQYQTIEQDAVFALVSQDDFLYTTNHKSHVVGWKKGLMDNLGLHVWAMASALEDDLGAPDETVYRFRIDLNFKF